MNFVGDICDIFHPQYLDIFKIVFICKACKIILYELKVTIILNMPYIYVVLSVILVIFFHQQLDIFNVFSFVRGVELFSHMTYFYFFI